MFIDLALSYSDGFETQLNKESNLNVGFIIKYKSGNDWINWKTVSFKSTELDNKNRIEYYYGFKNSEANRAASLRIYPTINGVESGNYIDFNFDQPLFTAQT